LLLKLDFEGKITLTNGKCYHNSRIGQFGKIDKFGGKKRWSQPRSFLLVNMAICETIWILNAKSS